MAKAQLTGPCSLCGSNRSSSCWRRLPDYTGNSAGQAACNACLVAVAKQARLDTAGVPAALQARRALRALGGTPSRKRRSPSKSLGGASPVRQHLAGTPSQCGSLHALKALLDWPASPVAAALPSSSAPDDNSSSKSSNLCPEGTAAAAGDGLPGAACRRSARQQQQQQQQQQQAALLWSPAPEGPQQPGLLSPTLPAVWSGPQVLGSPAVSATPAAAALPLAAQAELELDRQIEALQQANGTRAGNSVPSAAEQALLTVRRAAGDYLALAGVLPALELLLPGAGRAPLPVSALLITAQLPPPHGTALLVVAYCPCTGQLLRCREWLRQEEGRLYLHPRCQVVAWDSSEGWKLLFPEVQEGGPQTCLFKGVVACFGAQGPASVPQPPVLVSRITFPDLDGVADTQPGLLSSPSAATPPRQPQQQLLQPQQLQAWQLTSPEPAQSALLPLQSAQSPPQQAHPQYLPQWQALSSLPHLHAQPLHEQQLSPLQSLAVRRASYGGPVQQLQAEGAAPLWQQQAAPLSAASMPGRGPAGGGQPQAARMLFASAAPLLQQSGLAAEHLGSSAVLRTPAAARTGQQQLLAGGSQGAAACTGQAVQQSLAEFELLGPAPAGHGMLQPPPQMSVSCMPARLPLVQPQQAQHPAQQQQQPCPRDMPQWWTAADAHPAGLTLSQAAAAAAAGPPRAASAVGSPAGLPPSLAGSLGSQGQAGSGHFAAAAPAYAPDPPADHALLEEIDFGGLEEAALLDCLAGGELDGLLDCFLGDEVGSTPSGFHF